MRAEGDTIFALSSGRPPAAIALVRISGPAARDSLSKLAGRLPRPRSAALAPLHDPATGDLLDNALVLFFSGPGSATGEDVAELHLHGGRAVVARVLEVLGQIEGLRPAEPGEFTRRAFENGRLDLTEAEGLADLLTSETEVQRRAALSMAGGALSRRVADWQERLLAIAAKVEALLDFSDEADVEEEEGDGGWRQELEQLQTDLRHQLTRPAAERLKDGVKVVIAGPPNAGKSSLLNALAGREAAIVSSIPGTTRDLIEAPVALGSTPYLLVDTAGLRETDEEVERVGVKLASAALTAADIVLWLGVPDDCPAREKSIIVLPKADLGGEGGGADVSISAHTGLGMAELIALLRHRSEALLPQADEAALNKRHRDILARVTDHLLEALATEDPLVTAEMLRMARVELDSITGRAGVEQMLDGLFGRFCIGK